MYQRVGKIAFKKDLTNTISLLNALEKPHKKFPSIHLAGTNGKGSTSHMIASVFQAHGYKVGLYTSPHYKDFRERIKINGELIPKRTVSSFVSRNKDVFDAIKPSFFEMTVAMAFDYFAKQKVDIAIVETGLGGRLDSTNVLDPLMSVITNIALDHTEMLGTTLEAIATEKAGIIKQGRPVVIGESLRETKKVFTSKAKEKRSRIYFADKALSVKYIKTTKKYQAYICSNLTTGGVWNGKTDVRGPFQKQNLKTALMTCMTFSKIYPEWELRKRSILLGLQKVISSTYFIGRWQYIGYQPDVLCDSAHNLHAITEVLSAIKSMQYKSFHFVLGFSKGKDIREMIAILPKKGIYYLARPKVPRGLKTEEVIPFFKEEHLSVTCYTSVMDALTTAREKATKKDLIYVGGSSFVVAEVV